MTIPKHIMDEARALFASLCMNMPDCSDGDDVEYEIEKLEAAILAAEQRGREEERKAADKRVAEYAERWADRYERMLRSRTEGNAEG